MCGTYGTKPKFVQASDWKAQMFRWMDNTKVLPSMMGGCGWDSSGTQSGLVMVFYKYSNWPSCPYNKGNFMTNFGCSFSRRFCFLELLIIYIEHKYFAVLIWILKMLWACCNKCDCCSGWNNRAYSNSLHGCCDTMGCHCNHCSSSWLWHFLVHPFSTCDSRTLIPMWTQCFCGILCPCCPPPSRASVVVCLYGGF